MTQPSDDRAEVRVFPPGIPLAAVLAGAGLEYLWPIDTGSLLSGPYLFWLGAVIVAGSFLGFGVWSVVVFRRSGESPNPWKPTGGIVERGPFRVTRNPMYLQMVLICLGIALMAANLWILLLTPACAWALQHFVIRPEEAYLEAKFGDAYRSYKRRVRRWL